jgi:hypothetical protein
MKLTILLLFVCSLAYSQRYEYAEIYSVQSGIGGRGNADFYFSDNDSAKLYSQKKIPHVINAIVLLETRGWELITINNNVSGVASGNLVTHAYLRRKK